MAGDKQTFTYYLKLLFPFVKKDLGLLIFGLFAMLVTSGLRLLNPLILAQIIDHSIPDKNMAQMFQYGAYFVIVVLLSGLLSYLQILLLSRLGIKIITKFKGNVFSHLLKLPISWFNKQPVGELIARVESDSERVKVLFSDLSITIIGNVLFFIGGFVILFILQWQITIYILPAIILCGIGYWFLFKYLNKFFRLIRERYAIITAKITDYVQGIQMIQALNQEKKALQDVEKASLDKKKVEVHTQIIEYGSQSIFSFMINVVFIIIVILVSAPKIISWDFNGRNSDCFYSVYLSACLAPDANFGKCNADSAFFASLKRILELTELPTEDDTYTGTENTCF